MELRRRLLAQELSGLTCATCDKRGTCNLYGDPQAGASTAAPLATHAAGELVRLELGLTDRCSMRCIMCCLSWGEASPPGVPTNGVMDTALALKALRQARQRATGRPRLLLHWVGEPLLHPDIEVILAEAGRLDFELDLVTNAIGLTAPVRRALCRLPGEHVVSVSLNAVTEATFLRVNRSPLFQRVHEQLRAFLDERPPGITVAVTSVVLEDNLHEMPRFVRHWMAELSRYGRMEVGLNGRVPESRLQVQLLRELDDPLASARMRTALRKSGLERLWDGGHAALSRLAPLDALVLEGGGVHAGLDAWDGDRRLLPALAERCEGAALERVMAWWVDGIDGAGVRELAGRVSERPALAQALPLDWTPPDCGDASAAILEVARGRAAVVVRAEPWQVGALAGLLAWRPWVKVEVRGALPEQGLATHVVGCTVPAEASVWTGAAEWEVRALRRRWLALGKGPVACTVAGDGLEHRLTAAVVSVDGPPLREVISTVLANSTPTRLHDLADVLRARGGGWEASLGPLRCCPMLPPRARLAWASLAEACGEHVVLGKRPEAGLAGWEAALWARLDRRAVGVDGRVETP